MKKKESRGDRVVRFISEYCRAPEGKHIGKPLKLQPFQIRFLKDVYDNPHGTHTAVLSIARKNGKTALIAAILLCHLAGPEAVQNSQIVSGAMSKDQASIVFNLAVKMINLSPELSERVRIFPSNKRLLGLSKNVEYKALAADGKTAHGLSPILAILDELGQVKGPTDPFISAVETAQGAYDNPLKIIISTQAPTDADMLSLIIDSPDDPKIIKHIYAADESIPMDSEEAWKAANPALGVFRSLEDVKNQCAKAKAIPAFEPEFLNLILNRRVEATALFVTPATWKANGEDPGDGKRKKVWGGLDLAEVNDLTALVLVDEDGGVHPTFWLPEFGLREKSQKDRVPYDLWEKQGYLKTTPGKAVEYRYVAQFMRHVFDYYDVQSIAFDRYNIRFLIPWLVESGFSESELAKIVEMGQGTASMTPAIRDLEVKLLNAQLKHGNHPVMNMCAANAVVDGNNGARVFKKAKARGRMDGMVALAMAVGVMPNQIEQEEGDDGFYSNPIMVGV